MKIKELLSDKYISITNEHLLDNEFKGLYATDLLSQAIHAAKSGNILLTIISNLNTVAVAVMIDLPCIIICSQKQVAKTLIDKANDEGICMLSTKFHEHEVIIDLYQRGFL